MNCNNARKILNALMDGENHKLALRAQSHLEECIACKEWHSETAYVLDMLENTEPELLIPDIAGMVMSQLPQHHPASAITVPQPRRILLTLGLAWLFGIFILAITASTIYLRWHDGNGLQLMELSRYAHSLLSMNWLIAVMTGFGDIVSFIARTLKVLGEGLAPLFVQFMVLDCLALSTSVLIWRWRRSTTCAVIC